MTDFFVGQKVVCVDDAGPSTWCGEMQLPIKMGEVYTVRWVGVDDVKLVGICRTFDLDYYFDWPFYSRRFRPLESKSISLFRAIAQGVTDGKPIVDDPQRDFEHEAIDVLPFDAGRPI